MFCYRVCIFEFTFSRARVRVHALRWCPNNIACGNIPSTFDVFITRLRTDGARVWQCSRMIFHFLWCCGCVCARARWCWYFLSLNSMWLSEFHLHLPNCCERLALALSLAVCVRAYSTGTFTTHTRNNNALYIHLHTRSLFQALMPFVVIFLSLIYVCLCVV